MFASSPSLAPHTQLQRLRLSTVTHIHLADSIPAACSLGRQPLSFLAWMTAAASWLVSLPLASPSFHPSSVRCQINLP